MCSNKNKIFSQKRLKWDFTGAGKREQNEMRIRKSGRSLVGRQGCSAAIREQFSNASPTLQHLNYSFYMQHLTHSCIPIILIYFKDFSVNCVSFFQAHFLPCLV